MIEQHKEWVAKEGRHNITVVEGKIGMIHQSMECYRAAHRFGAKYYFRLDDDLYPKFFVEDDGYTELENAMIAARICAGVLNVSLAGFVNTSRVDWLGTDFRRSYGLITGGACLALASLTPENFLDEQLPAYEDVYRSAAHRERDGAVGRVSFIGVNKIKALRGSSMNKSPEVIAIAKDIILQRFPRTVTCKGERVLDGGRQTIPNWRLVRGDCFWE